MYTWKWVRDNRKAPLPHARPVENFQFSTLSIERYIPFTLNSMPSKKLKN